jgi:cytochrome c oxidase subunit 3/cytochrome o ubiquinol oxidase subunit 3
VIGVIMMLVTLALAFAGAVGPQHAYRVRTLGLYWHFVDAVWVVVFTVVYVVGR